MPIELELVHASAKRCVVLARLIEAGALVAAALGEAATAEEAEERARARLRAQPVAAPVPPVAAPAPARAAAPAPAPAPVRPQAETQTQALLPTVVAEPEPEAEPPADPDDWSSELAQLDLQLKRLGWSREQEATYLLRAFGHSSRSRLTTYADLLAYLRALERFQAGEDPGSCAVPLKRSDLLGQSDQLLSQLGWTANQGRQLLESRFQRSSRQQLSDSQLLEFNMLLESELLNTPLSSESAAG
ncbi:MAG: hypothetical protein FJ078_00560 [Cyanobacteria bacterium K_DeepCast_35m_m2_155]|nr:hypothetical protein [Cyanobacteria bacterium K_DeepCast_35m_m2_155]